MRNRQKKQSTAGKPKIRDGVTVKVKVTRCYVEDLKEYAKTLQELERDFLTKKK
jgi:hypothetical protein